MLSNKIKKGDVLALFQYSKVTSVRSDGKSAIVETEDGNRLTYQGIIDKDYVLSADHCDTEEKKTKTELEEIFKNARRLPMTVTWYKQADPKRSAEIITTHLYANEGGSLMSKDAFTKKAKKLATDIIRGELRTARGYHDMSYGNGGRIRFVDMDKEHDSSKDYDTRVIQVDPRTIQEIIVAEVKYTLK